MRVISVHEYDLRPGTDPLEFEIALRAAEQQGLLDLPGLIGHHFVKGLKGERRGGYSAIWIYRSREAWERIWGAVDKPAAYPANWIEFEERTLKPFLADDPDAIRFTTYEEI